jgi:uncharacterized protein
MACTLGAQATRVLIVDGINNHDWEAGTRFLREVLDGSGAFQTDVTTTPKRGAPPEEWERWRPEFAKYRLVIQNFNGGHTKDGLRWPKSVEEDFLKYVKRGGGVIIFHAANNAFLEWPEYNEMTGLLWRDKSFGPGLVVDATRKPMPVAAGDGPQPGHGPRHDFRVDVLDREHPATRGLPAFWMHRAEQLTHGQHGPAAALPKLHILTYAWSRDSQRNEPMDWVRNWGKGRVYVTMLGHTWRGEDNPNLRVPEFRKLLLQAAKWTSRR